MSISTGIDIAVVERFEKNSADPAFSERLLTEREKALVKNRPERMAAVFSAKEAVMKALGTGWDKGVGWKDIEVHSLFPLAAVSLRAKAEEVAAGKSVFLSVSCSSGVAVAFAVVS